MKLIKSLSIGRRRKPGEIITQVPVLIRNKCKECVGYDEANSEIRDCTNKSCWFWSRRFGYNKSEEDVVEGKPKKVTKILTRPRKKGEYIKGVRVVRLFCLNCSGNRAAVRRCPATRCWNWPLRFGDKQKAREMVEKEDEKMEKILEFLEENPNASWAHIIE